MANPDAGFLAAFDAIPEGSHRGQYDGRDWLVTKSALAQGRAQKLLARELGGPGYVSLNVYRLASGARLKPCEMPEAAARAFVTGVRLG